MNLSPKNQSIHTGKWSASRLARLALTLAVGLVLPATAALADDRPEVFPPQSRPFGHSYPEWHARWWQWAISIPMDGHHPQEDQVGVDAARGQSGPVWFLCGVFNISGTATRSIVVPEGKALFFPVLNTECSTLEPDPFHGDTEAGLRDCAESFVGVNLACEIDGRSVRNLSSYEATSPLFPFIAPDSNVLFVPGGGPGYSVDHGTYLMVHDLSVGRHTIHFKGAYLPFEDPTIFGGFALDITYHVTIAPRH